METTQTQKEQMEVAQMRFGVIAPLVQGTYTDVSMAAYCRRVAQTPQRLPDGRVFQYKPKTVAKWYQLYEKGGMEALVPRTRCDKGGTRVIPEEAGREISRLKKEYPRLNATQIREKLVQDGILPATVSVSTIQRYIKHNGLRGMQEAPVKDRKAYKEEYFGGMWQVDTCYLPYIRENGKSRRVYLIMILDDHSRMIVGGNFIIRKTPPTSRRRSKRQSLPTGSRINCMWITVPLTAMNSFPLSAAPSVRCCCTRR